MQGICGEVKISIMKYHTMLQALFKYTGLEGTFKDICKDRKIGTR